MPKSDTTPDEKEIKRLAAFTFDSIAANGYSQFGQPSPEQIFKIVHHALCIAAGHEQMIDWENPYDVKLGWKPPEPLIDRLKKHFAKSEGA